MFKKIKKAIGFGLLGLGLAYNINCGKYDVEYKELPNNPPVIMTNQLENITAGDYLKQKIKVIDLDSKNLEFYLEESPEGMQIDNNGVITWSTRHSNIDPSFPEADEFNIKVKVSDGKNVVSKNYNLNLLENTDPKLDYLRTNEDIRFVCESPCNFNENYLDLKSSGVFNGIKKLKNLIQADTPDQFKPVDLHLIEIVGGFITSKGDSLCRGWTEMGYYELYGNFDNNGEPQGTLDGRHLICTYNEPDADGNGSFSRWAESPDDIRSQSLAIHEYVHVIFNNRSFSVNFQHSFDPGIFITQGSGYFGSELSPEPLESRCDPRITNPGFSSIACDLSAYLCTMFGFDFDDYDEFFKKYTSNKNVTVQDAKCMIDDIVKFNTYDAFNKANENSRNPINGQCNYPLPLPNKFIIEDKYCGN